MKLSYQEYGPILVLTISGEFTAEDVGVFERAANERLGAGSRHVMIDCEHLEFIDSAGLESWLRVRDEVGQQNGQVRLINPDVSISKILEITRMDKSFEALPSLEAAVRSVR
ncbi:MAG: STAS domain-containing protein [Phycisphaerales bacterium]